MTSNNENSGTVEKLAQGIEFLDLLAYKGQKLAEEDRLLLDAIVDLLISKGIMSREELARRKEELARSSGKDEEGRFKVRLWSAPEAKTVTSDCENRFAVCKGVCCKLWFALTVADLNQRVIDWDYAQPFVISHGDDGYCVHHDRGCYKCTIYERRPLICRVYDCRDDKRIWADYEKMILNKSLLLP
jgi:Fe-S-cluster containining protein